MSYTVLARRYRSSTFDDLIGQEHVARTLKRAIESGRIAHAFLFCGTRGTGKTSTARILAKCLNCESSDKPTVKPCGQCESCKGIARGDDIDVIEIDAASNRGIDEVRKIIENARFSPARARFKVYIIDEVHAMTKDAFNALLKVLEEPPAHVKFILATTEPEKVLATILSRCQRYDFRNIPTREIAGHLKAICTTEKVEADDDAILLVAKAGAGSMRDALSLMDRLLSLGETRITVEMIENLLGLPKTQLLFNLADAIGRGDTKATLQQANAIIRGGLSPDALIAALIDHLRNLLILSTCGPESDLVDVPGLPLADLVNQANQFDAIALSQDIAILEELRRTLRTSQAGAALLDATLVRLALAEQFASIDALITGNGAASPGQKKKSEPVGAAAPPAQARAEVVRSLGMPPAPVATIAPVAPPIARTPGEPAAKAASPVDPSLDAPASHSQGLATSVARSPAPNPAPVAPTPAPVADEPPVDLNNIDLGDDDSLPSVGRVWEGPAPSLSTIMSQNRSMSAVASKPVSDMANVEPVVNNLLSDKWNALLAMLDQHSQGLYGILSQGGLDRIENGQAVVKFPSGKDFLLKLLDRNGKRESVAQAFTQLLGTETGVRFIIDDTAAAAPPPGAARSVPAPVVPANPRHAVKPQPAAPPPMPETPTIRLTQEIKDAIYAEDPLVKTIVDQLGGEIVKVEEN
ncbi:MAG TPA: DNA polymerase III subunit gamma/tau [Tepidisphaeraceae bacterium]|jgi:DNA polymerase-3 subunit gamma/tau|nr:DNA polymerase III subunit gamma/tau [Tepidisphaeraceae bacterium]